MSWRAALRREWRFQRAVARRHSVLLALAGAFVSAVLAQHFGSIQ